MGIHLFLMYQCDAFEICTQLVLQCVKKNLDDVAFGNFVMVCEKLNCYCCAISLTMNTIISACPAHGSHALYNTKDSVILKTVVNIFIINVGIY